MGCMLVTGFEPFGGEGANPSWDAVSALPAAIGGLRVEKLRVPVVFGLSGSRVVESMRVLDPLVVVCVGQAGGRTCVTPERVAVNVADARVADNSGAMPAGLPVVADGPASYLSTLPLERCVRAMGAVGVPAQISNTAGTYVCNQLMYRVLHEQSAGSRTAAAGFVHVPFSCGQAVAHPAEPSMSVEVMARGLEAMLAETVSSLS